MDSAHLMPGDCGPASSAVETPTGPSRPPSSIARPKRVNISWFRLARAVVGVANSVEIGAVVGVADAMETGAVVGVADAMETSAVVGVADAMETGAVVGVADAMETGPVVGVAG